MSLNQLTSTYADSDGEVEQDKEYGEASSDSYSSGNDSPKSNESTHSKEENPPPAKKTSRLVSYMDEDGDLADDTEEEPDEILNSEPMDTESEDEEKKAIDYGIKLPPAPTAKCPEELQRKINQALGKVEGGRDYNIYINRVKAFRNPSIYEKLVNHISLEELGTNHPLELQDCMWGPESFYDELSKAQNEFMEKREKERKAKQAENANKNQSQNDEEVKKRKSRFDQGVPPPAKPTVTVTTAGTTTTTSTVSSTNSTSAKTTISAFGALKRTK